MTLCSEAGDAILAAVVRTSLDCIIVADDAGRVLLFNPAAEQVFGIDRAAALGRPIGALIVPPHHRAAHEAGMARMRAGGTRRMVGRCIEIEAMRADGTVFPCELAIREITAAGRVLFAASLRDLSAARAAETELRAATALLAAIFDDQTEFILRYDAALTIVFCNDAVCRAFGRPREALVGMDFWVHVDPEIRPRLTAELAALTPERPFTEAVDPKRLPDGRVLWIEWRNRALFNAAGRLVGYQSVGRDVTDRHLAEQALAASEARFAAFMRNAPVGMYLKDAAGRYLLANPEMEHVFGRPVAAVLGRTAAELFDADLAALIAGADRAVCETGRASETEELLEGAARYEWTLVVRFPVAAPDGVVQIGGFDIDITRLKRAEADLARSREALHQSEKLNAMGSLVAGVAHELNNPLAIVAAQAEMLAEDLEGTALASRAERIRQAAGRCGRIVRTFLAMARSRPPERAPVDLNALVEDALEILGYALRSGGVLVTRRLAPDLQRIEADADQLQQVLLNLIVNAQQAMEAITAPRELLLATRAEGGSAVLEIADAGPGVAPDHRGRIFEPFFTTKPEGAGTGIGLSFCRGVIEAQGGSLTLAGAPAGGPRGACFRIALPIAAAGGGAAGGGAVPVPAAALPAGPPPDGQRRAAILVIDDEPDIAELIADMLVSAGHAAEAVASSAAAQERLAAGDWDAVVADLRMPGLDGSALHAWLAAQRPALARRMVFVTGDALGQGAARFLAESGRPVLEKPFTRAGLLALVAEALAGA